MGERPYVVFGDSHAHHYVRKEKFGSTWLAAMPLVCHGASAGSLTHGDPFSKEGAAIMRWAEANARLKLPIFLKFGGLDADDRDSADYYMDHETIGAKLAPLLHRLAAG